VAQGFGLSLPIWEKGNLGRRNVPRLPSYRLPFHALELRSTSLL
jgi:hypothetical protein